MRWLDGITDSMDMGLSELWRWPGGRHREAHRILASCNPWSCKESDMTQRLIISLFVKYFFVPVATLTIVFLIFLLIVVANILER